LRHRHQTGHPASARAAGHAQHLADGPPPRLLNATTVHDDAAVDQLEGNGGSDWFLYTAGGAFKDVLRDKGKGEIATAV
jgi:hypothetical protein